MLRRHACAGLALIALCLTIGVALIAASPASSQTAATDPPQAAPQQSASPAPAASPSTPASEPAPPAPVASPAPAPAQPTPAVAETPPPPPIDPLVAEVRRQLAEPAKGNVDRTDRTALAAFYGARNEPLLWVTSSGFTAKARHAMAEIAKADDWGLSASAFELPKLAPGDAATADLAGAEIKLGLAVLKYARAMPAVGAWTAPSSASISTRSPPCASRKKSARGYGRDRYARHLPARSPSQARAIPAFAPSPVEGAGRRPSCQTCRAAEIGDPCAAARGAYPKARLRAPRRCHCAPAARPTAAEGRGEHLRSRGAGRAQGVPGAEQYSDDGHADTAHALGAQRRGQAAAGGSQARACRPPTCSG